LEYWRLYNDLTSRLLHDKQIQNIKNHLLSGGENLTHEILPNCSNTTIHPQENAFEVFHNGIIEPKNLKQLIENRMFEVLVIDFRSREEFKKNHILCDNIICVEPVSIRSRYTDSDIENFAILTSPDVERELFMKRDTFELIIVYDEKSQSINDSESLSKFLKIMSQKSFEKPLKREPVFLRGGIQSWISNFGLSSFGHNHGELSQPHRLVSRTPSQNRSFNSPIARSFNDYLSNPVKNDFQSTTTTSFNGSTVQHQIYTQRQQSPPVKRSNSFKLPSLRSVTSSPKISQASRSKHSATSDVKPSPSPKTLTPESTGFKNDNEAQVLRSGTINIQELNCTTGLCNIGNSCYMNCIIQCLLGTNSLMQIFLNGSYKQHVNINSKLGTKGIMAKFFAELAQSVFQKSNSIYEPRNFKIAVGSINSMFKNDEEQDCSEFLNFVLDGLHEDLNEAGNRPRLKELTEEEENYREKMPVRLASTIEWERYLKNDFSAIVSIFQGQYSSQLKCLECGTTSTTYQAFSVLSLPIPERMSHKPGDKITLDKCLEEFTKLEILDGEDRWFCSKCKKLRKSTKKITITRLPSNLIIHFKRFKSGMNIQKMTSFIEYPFEMDLTSYWPKVCSKDEEQRLLHFPLRGQTLPFKYSLYGVANHSGSLGSGHYTSYVWKGASKKWCYFDDTRVVKNVSKSHVINSNAYVLFYKRVN